MDDKRKVTIAIAWLNLVEDTQANDDIVTNFLKTKSIKDLEQCAEYLLQNYTTEQMIAAAEKYSK